MTKKTKSAISFWSIFVIAFGLLFCFNYYILKQDAKEIKENTAYAIGVYDGYVTTHSRGGGTSVFVSFFDNDKYYHKKPIRGLKGQYNGDPEITLDQAYYKVAKKGEKYLVIYSKKDPDLCQILFDHPIKDSTDFKNYMNEFKTKPLNLDKYFKW